MAFLYLRTFFVTPDTRKLHINKNRQRSRGHDERKYQF